MLCNYSVVIGFKVETDLGINASSVPVLIFRLLFVLRVLKVQIWGSSDHFFFSKFRQRIPIDVANRFFCPVIPWVTVGSTVETDVEVDEGSA